MDDDAVSPVIGVILMVAITVVLAAIVFLLTVDLTADHSREQGASVSVTSPTGVLHIALLTGGQNAPYAPDDGTPRVNAYTIAIDGIACDVAGSTEAASTFPASWAPGGVARIDGRGPSGDGSDAAGCEGPVTGGKVTVTVAVAGTVIFDDTVAVRALP